MGQMFLEEANASWSADCPQRLGRYWCEDASSTEREVGLLLAGLVRALQPEVVVELGGANGATSEMLCKALVSNGHGRLHVVEIDHANRAKIAPRVSASYCSIVAADARTWAPPTGIDLLYVDDGPVNDRIISLAHHLAHMTPSGIIAVHDTGSHWTLGRQLRAAFCDASWQLIQLPTPRGLTLLRHAPDLDCRPRPIRYPDPTPPPAV